ncbi:hypothetical protein TGDOM2_320610 [Toxoplasma gondii GAB2-2007-GAL-DOM2]|uniref:SAC3/GANP/THP3 conserved domain-containing protein n=4 Tax=Toxoplasma gondii TaxID=5811 RepID=B9QIG4_TOXGV|nr:hypothetical protein TGVEG_320610 [Toxoplasma gondii VEG]KFG32663.1 hypothetical protein TGDOM2_320610 [Toxoplasma gondii GAB2-2007-GAL-DOM2]KFG43994.1 hypothetical protein TGP89_320610 [Toxoplasma gondii p89]PUA88593.1 hypothetical protein TGBR9_320610 [Toxoplasma gondii TgCATBr9]
MSGQNSFVLGRGVPSVSPRPFCCSTPALSSLNFCSLTEYQSRTGMRMLHPFEVGAGRCLVTQFVRSTGPSRDARSRCRSGEKGVSRACSQGKVPDNIAGSPDVRPRDSLLPCCDYLLRRLLPSVLSECFSGNRTPNLAPAERKAGDNARCSRCGRPQLESEQPEQEIVRKINEATANSSDFRRELGPTTADTARAAASPSTSAVGGGSACEGGSPVAGSFTDMPEEGISTVVSQNAPRNSAAIAYSFFSDRLRAIRQDAVRQRLNTPDLFVILLQCARFHLFAEYFWGGGMYRKSTASSEPASWVRRPHSPNLSDIEVRQYDSSESGVAGAGRHLSARTPPLESAAKDSHLESANNGAQVQEVSPEATFRVSGFSPSLNRFLLSSCLVQLLGITLRESRRFRLLKRRKKREHKMGADCRISGPGSHKVSSEETRTELEEFARGLGVEISEIDEVVAVFLLSQTLAVPVQTMFNSGQERSIFVIQEITRALGVWLNDLPWSVLALRMTIQASSGVDPRRALLSQERAPLPFLLQCAVYPHADRLRAVVLAEIKASAVAAVPGTVVSMKQLIQLMACGRAEDATSVCLRLGAGEPVYSQEARREAEGSSAEGGSGRDSGKQRPQPTHSVSLPAPRHANSQLGEGHTGDAKSAHPANFSSDFSKADHEAVSAQLQISNVTKYTYRHEVVAGIRFRRTDETTYAPGHTLATNGTKKEPGKQIRFSEILALVGSDSWMRSAPSFVMHAPVDVEELRNIFAWPPPLVKQDHRVTLCL